MTSLREKLLPFEKLAGLRDSLKGVIVSTNGCFDLLHLGHILYLEQARTLGDHLVVGINGDASVRRLKGSSRPIQDQNTRALQVAGLASVRFVTIFNEENPIEFLKALSPQVHVKGGDYKGKEIVEDIVLKALKAKVRFVDFIPGFSTTDLISKIKSGNQEK